MRSAQADDELSVVQGFLGAYPNALYDLARADLDAFVDAVGKLDSNAAYRALPATEVRPQIFASSIAAFSSVACSWGAFSSGFIQEN
ncbi:hypothetical protein BH09MYX1_BH09MYX1_64470 [soil metagenome]